MGLLGLAWEFCDEITNFCGFCVFRPVFCPGPSGCVASGFWNPEGDDTGKLWVPLIFGGWRDNKVLLGL